MSDANKGMAASPRYRLIDGIRGFVAVNMIVYHILYDLFCVYSMEPGFAAHPAAAAWERWGSFTFILISGISIYFSRHGYRRGLIVLLGGAAITVLTLIFLPSEIIWFGILHFLGFAILVTFALRKVFLRIVPTVGAGISLPLFALLYGLPDGYIGFFGARIANLPAALYTSPWLAAFGLPSKGFYSADYFPILPWIFLYFCGFFLWRIIMEKGWDSFFLRRIPVFDRIGRYCFVIYMLHQPLIFGVCYIIFGHF